MWKGSRFTECEARRGNTENVRYKSDGGGEKKKNCCCNINANTRIRIFLLIMPKLPGRVSGFSPLPCPGTPATSPQRRLPCRDELLTGPKTACLMLCQARHGAAGMLAASWPTPCITGLSPFHPSFSSSLSLSLSSASGLLCKAFQEEIVGVLLEHRCIQIIFVQSPVVVRDGCSGRRAAVICTQQPGVRLWPHLGHVPHLPNTETPYLESNSNFSSLSQITTDSC